MPRLPRDQWTLANCMRHLQAAGDFALFDLAFGVRTRAKTLALERLPRLPPPPPPPPSTSGYLQLRSRRLVKPPLSKRQKHGQEREAHNPSPCSDAALEVRVGPMDFQIEAKESDDCRSSDNCDIEGVERLVPTATEMEEFFTKAETELNRQFIDKYNFDPVNDKPLPGRFEWEKLDPLTGN